MTEAEEKQAVYNYSSKVRIAEDTADVTSTDIYVVLNTTEARVLLTLLEQAYLHAIK